MLGHGDYLRGRLRLQGVDPYELAEVDPVGLLDVAWATIVDGFGTTFRDRGWIMAKLLETMDESPVPSEDEWGTSEVAQRRAAAMEQIAGAPAPMRPPDAEVPESVRRAREELAQRLAAEEGASLLP